MCNYSDSEVNIAGESSLNSYIWSGVCPSKVVPINNQFTKELLN